jgi:ubiquinone/menaquinone biosynthesis C-methylase UbiE
LGLYAEHVFPWLLDCTEAKEMGELRRRALRDVRGDVLEIGVGTGASLPHYPRAIRELTAVEPSEGMQPRALRRARELGIAIDWRRGEGEHLPFEDRRFDSLVVIDVLCSVRDVDAVLAEAFRVLRPAGRLHFLEHGLSSDERVRRWQRRLNGFSMLTSCGCHLTREPARHLRRSPFVLDELVEEGAFPHFDGPLFPHIRGIATRTA